ncbi:MAG TPA: hypothetical protein VGI50_17850 [Solirubrobacteraceae bacterium]
MAQRSRKKGRRTRPPAPAVQTASPGSRSAQRDAAVRATLIPFAPGERPAVILIGAGLAALSGVVQLVLFVAGVRLHSTGLKASAGQTIAFTVLMLLCAGGMLAMRYWAVLGFMALLAILLVFAIGALVKASSVIGAVIALAIVVGGGWLFFKLVRVLSRIQMPKYPSR